MKLNDSVFKENILCLDLGECRQGLAEGVIKDCGQIIIRPLHVVEQKNIESFAEYIHQSYFNENIYGALVIGRCNQSKNFMRLFSGFSDAPVITCIEHGTSRQAERIVQTLVRQSRHKKQSSVNDYKGKSNIHQIAAACILKGFYETSGALQPRLCLGDGEFEFQDLLLPPKTKRGCAP